MAEITTAAVPSESGHWYDRQGRMVELVPGANGNMVKPDIRHARKLGLLPGVTSVLKVQSAPALTNWLIDQALMAALTLPRVEGETLDQFKERARRDAQETGKKAADRGTDLHTALELAVQRKPFDGRWERHIEAVDTNLRLIGVDMFAGDPERSFAHPLGFGGKNDWHCKRQGALLDYKSKDKINGGKRLAWDDHVQQLTACREGLCMDPQTRLLNVFVGVEDAKVQICEWEPEDKARGWEMFRTAMRLWQLRNKYDSSFSIEQEAA